MGALVGPKLVREWLRKYPLAPRWRRRERVRLSTLDEVSIGAASIEGPPDAPLTVVLVHGFANSSRSPRVYAFARALSEQFHVVAPDLRGHGSSSGRSSLGLLEPLDVSAAVEYACAVRPRTPVVTVGASLGAIAVLLHAGLFGRAPGNEVLGTVAISAPAVWGATDGPSSVRLAAMLDSPSALRILRYFCGTRVVSKDRRVPVPFAGDVIAAIAPAFTIVVHDPVDKYFPGSHAERVHGWASDPRDLWWLHRAGHGSDMLTRGFADRLTAELLRRVPGPERQGLSTDAVAPARPAGPTAHWHGGA